jgi:hypothetical protein
MNEETQSAYNMFEDPAFVSAKARLPDEEKEKYESIGNHMYDYDYTGDGLNNLIKSAAIEITFTICQGFHPSCLEKSEKDIMIQTRGQEWYMDFGYTKQDLDDIVTVPQDLPIPLKSNQINLTSSPRQLP